MVEKEEEDSSRGSESFDCALLLPSCNLFRHPPITDGSPHIGSPACTHSSVESQPDMAYI